MLRVPIKPRRGWEKIVKDLGLTYHTLESGKPYWDESAYYTFNMEQIELIESATNDLHGMCLEAVQKVITDKLYKRLAIPEKAIPYIEYSWENETPAIYGRFDLAYDGEGRPKLYEYNADTPTSLLEASVVQWAWMEQVKKGADQFNSIHERLIDKWKSLREHLFGPPRLHLLHMDSEEDYMTVGYMGDVAMQAGLNVCILDITQVGWNGSCFVDMDTRPMTNLFKLYPWEWILNDAFSQHVDLTKQNWIEPPWKMVLANKGILAVLWEMNPDHPNLLETYIDTQKSMTAFAKKPLYSREGSNVTIAVTMDDGSDVSIEEKKGLYGKEGYVYQELCAPPCIERKYPVIGSWVIDGQAAGMGIRESDGPITDNTSRFVPHVIE